MTDLSFATQRRRGLPGLTGGLVALTYPLLLTALAVGQGFARGSISGFATAFLAALLFLIAAPTAWIFAFDFIDVSAFTIIAVGLVTSLPLWYAVGAGFARISAGWPDWLRRYGTTCVVWTSLNLAVLAILAAL